MTETLSGLARDGVLRAAINTGNRALVRREGDALLGVSPALARLLAEELGAELRPVVYDGAGRVFEDADRDVWDIAFLATDPLRATKVTFSQPYHVIEATYAVRDGTPIRTPEDADRKGVTILASKGSAYELYLRRALAEATLEHSATPGDSFREFSEGRADAVAGVRASLERAFANAPGIHILPGVLTKVEQAMVLPRPNDARQAALDDFVARAVASGLVAREVG